MKCPAGKTPFRSDWRSDKPMPLFVPPAMLEAARAAKPKLWIEPMPDHIPYNRALEPRDFEES